MQVACHTRGYLGHGIEDPKRRGLLKLGLDLS